MSNHKHGSVHEVCVCVRALITRMKCAEIYKANRKLQDNHIECNLSVQLKLNCRCRCVWVWYINLHKVEFGWLSVYRRLKHDNFNSNWLIKTGTQVCSISIVLERYICVCARTDSTKKWIDYAWCARALNNLDQSLGFSSEKRLIWLFPLMLFDSFFFETLEKKGQTN